MLLAQSDTLAQDTGTQDALTLVTDGSTQFAVNDIIRLKEGLQKNICGFPQLQTFRIIL